MLVAEDVRGVTACVVGRGDSAGRGAQIALQWNLVGRAVRLNKQQQQAVKKTDKCWL